MKDGISICLCVYNRPEYLRKTLDGIYNTVKGNYELIIVDDCSTDAGVQEEIEKEMGRYGPYKYFYNEGTGSQSGKATPRALLTIRNEKSLKHARSQNLAFSRAEYDIIVHLEADCAIVTYGWDDIVKDYFNKYPEIGMLVPTGSGRADVLKRPGYVEVQWALGGFWMVRRQVYEEVGAWDARLVHQVECDYDLRIRMAGWRIAEIPQGERTIQYIHLGEGDYAETVERQAQLHEGVFNFIKKWNLRFNGFNDYNGIFSRSWDDMPINEIFRRQCTACLGLNKEVKQIVLPNDGEGKSYGWGNWDLIVHTRPPGREREAELATVVQQNKVFKTEGSLEGNNKDRDFAPLLKDRELDCNWIYVNKATLKRLDELGIDYGR